ncbi:MAG: stage III sporulation protein AF [Lachnospiraceae bacterium]|nr:stage III sporulation protein AF [Lachnospiraceae bacterium]
MEGIFQWVKSITYYLIFVRLISNLLPNGKYERYVRLFSGAVFLLLAAEPLTGVWHLEEKLAYAYEKISFQQESGEFEKKLWGIEQQQLDLVMARYEEAVSEDVAAMAKEAGLGEARVSVEIEKEEDAESFGQVKGMVVRLASGGTEGQQQAETEMGQQAGPQAETQVEPVLIQVEGGATAVTEEEEPAQLPRKHRLRKQEEQEALNGFKRRLAEYYGLEEKDVRIE